MPRLTRWFIKTSLVEFVLALVIGIWMALAPSLWGSALSWTFPVYIHLLAFGWLTQLIFGVAFWMFPKFTLDKPHASEFLGWVCYGLLNLGLLLRAVGEPLNTTRPSSIWGGLLVISALLQWLAGLAFVVDIWGRVKVK